jgi:hypothetical protein
MIPVQIRSTAVSLVSSPKATYHLLPNDWEDAGRKGKLKEKNFYHGQGPNEEEHVSYVLEE